MKILVASDSFKETLSSEEVGLVIKKGLPMHDVDIVSISDGGEGIIEALESQLQGKRITLSIHDPLGRLIKGYYYLAGDTAVIESAIGCGLALLNGNEKNPFRTSSYGVGELIKDAISNGAKHIIAGIGGTSTNDCGIGILEALGVMFYNSDGLLLSHVAGGDLKDIKSFDITDFLAFIKEVSFEIACDVDNPLLGEHGATYTFGPQKGATPEICTVLEMGMTHFSRLIEKTFNEKYIDIPGSGAAGGIGMCFVSFFDGHLKSGIDLVLDVISFDQKIIGYDLLITGEGKMDKQTSRGKVPQGILKRTTKQNIKTIAVCGYQESKQNGFEAVYAVVPTVASFEESMAAPAKSLLKLVEEKIAPDYK